MELTLFYFKQNKTFINVFFADSTCLDRADCGAGSGNATVDDDDLVCRAGWHCIDQVCRCGFGFQRPDNFNGRP